MKFSDFTTAFSDYIKTRIAESIRMQVKTFVVYTQFLLEDLGNI